MNFSKNLKNIRKNYHISRITLSLKTGITVKQILKWEYNISKPNINDLIILSELFKTGIPTLLFEDIPKEPNKFVDILTIILFLIIVIYFITNNIILLFSFLLSTTKIK